jgi:integrase
MLTMRARGAKKIYYIRGTVSYGDRRIDVPEFSSGTSSRDAASNLMAQHEQRLFKQLMFGPEAQVAQATMADAFEAYLNKPTPPNSSDRLRLTKLNEAIGGLPLNDPLTAWRIFRNDHLLKHEPSGQDRYRSLLQSAVNVFRAERGLDKVKVPAIKFHNERVRFLSLEEQDLLISCYVPHVQPIILVLAFQGARTQDALQLQWGRQGVDIKTGEIWIYDAKTRKFRMVPMHPRVLKALTELWETRGRPTSGHVFLSRLGKPYQDTRKAKIQGGNPLKSAHRTACKRAGITDFTLHDWRHHFASHCMMAGVDIESLRQLGGWVDYRMVKRYTAVDAKHLRASIAKLGERTG